MALAKDLAAMNRLAKIVDALEGPERERVLSWFLNREQEFQANKHKAEIKALRTNTNGGVAIGRVVMPEPVVQDCAVQAAPQ